MDQSLLDFGPSVNKNLYFLEILSFFLSSSYKANIKIGMLLLAFFVVVETSLCTKPFT